MGGLAIQTPPQPSEPFLRENSGQTWFITRDGISCLLQGDETVRDELPDLSEEEIESKSKANGLAKSLVCLQALWFITQCLTRRKFS